jgi:hypothetical protein
VKGIEPSQPAWKAGALPLSYTRGDVIVNVYGVGLVGFEPTASCSQSRRAAKLRHSPCHVIVSHLSIVRVIRP